MRKSTNLARLLKNARRSAELSQQTVARDLGYRSGQFVSSWERGISYPPIRVLKRLGKLYEVKPETLYRAMLHDELQRVRRDLHAEFFGRGGKGGR